jgi:hypothetical protein
LAEKHLDHKTWWTPLADGEQDWWTPLADGEQDWWTPLADGEMVLHVLMRGVCLSVDLCMVDLSDIT